MNLSTLNHWLSTIQTMSAQSIQLGLERVKKVGHRLGVLTPNAHIVTIAGTNGKGSTVATLEKIYLTAGFRVGCFTSPYLLRFTEQIRVNCTEVTEEALCAAFKKIATVRGDVLLTPFEWTSLAAFIIFADANLDIILLEVGLGGRLDAVNCIDTKLAIITSISLDHCEYLGNTRESIGYEKAGIFRANVPAIYGGDDIPASIKRRAQELKIPLYQQGIDFSFTETKDCWSWQSASCKVDNLPKNSLYVKNLSTALMAVQLAQEKCPVSSQQIQKALSHVELAARVQVVQKETEIVYDVSHNPAACRYLASRILAMPKVNKTISLFSMLGDKEILASIMPLKDIIDEWHVFSLENPRAATLSQLKTAFQELNIKQVTFYQSARLAYNALQAKIQKLPRLIVFGSFHTVAEVLALTGSRDLSL